MKTECIHFSNLLPQAAILTCTLAGRLRESWLYLFDYVIAYSFTYCSLTYYLTYYCSLIMYS